MKPDRRSQIDWILEGALKLSPGQRAAFVEQECASDKSMREEVDSLLSAYQKAGRFLEAPALMDPECRQQIGRLFQSALKLEAGKKLGCYQVLRLLGSGGMGEVYLAEDTRLGRKVALKVLPKQLTWDPNRLHRFRQDARAASALNHPNIITIFDIDETEDTYFIVMEFIDGETLRQRITAGKIVLHQALEVALQISRALAVAHHAGIVHRDLKPENVMVTADGNVKLLDFGLAKLTEDDRSNENSGFQTEDGIILGTIDYMSPEQAEGKRVDARSDVFSFGVVFYEMLAGERPFQAETKISTLAAILTCKPRPLSEARPEVSADVERIVRICLCKEARRRFQSMGDVEILLETALAEKTAAKQDPVEATGGKRRALAVWTLAVVLLAGAAAAGTWWWARRATPTASPQLVLHRLTRDTGLTTDPALSPDGKFVAYASDRSGEANLDIWVQQIAGGKPIRLTHHGASDRSPRFSPDGARIVFASGRDGGGIYVVSMTGGDEQLVAKHGHRPRFSPDGSSILYDTLTGLRNSAIYIAPATGGPSRKVETVIERPGIALWSPDGKRILFGEIDIGGFGPEVTELWSVSEQGGKVIATGLKQLLERHRITTVREFDWAGSNLVFAAESGDSRNLWRVRSSPPDWTLSGAPERITAGTGESKPSASVDGRIAFSTDSTTLDLWTIDIDANTGRTRGKLRRLPHDDAADRRPTLSADGKRLVFLSNRNGNSDVWARDMETGEERPLTQTPVTETHPVISPNGSWVAYLNIPEDQNDQKIGPLYLVPFRGDVPEKLCDDCGNPMDWSPDGKRITIWHGKPIRYSTIDVVTREKKLLVQHPKYEIHTVRYSPDGRSITFRMPISPSRSIVYVALLRDGSAPGEEEWIEIADNGTHSWWSPDGNLVYFLSERDGFQCIFARRLDPATKRPVAEPFSVQHFHDGRRSISRSVFGNPNRSVRLVFSLVELTGNIWLASPE